MRTFFLTLARADTAFFILPALMVLLIIGTLAQRWMGLYDSQHMFFSSLVFWAGPIPVPGGALLIGLLMFGLSLKFIFKSRWSVAKAGIHLTHLGALVLLGGGFLTALLAEESYMIIPEGEASPYIYDYYQRDLTIMKGESTLGSIPFEKLTDTNAWPALPFNMTVLRSCRNCDIVKREDDSGENPDGPYRGMARFMSLHPAPPAVQAEENLSGLTFRVTGLSEAQNGIYLTFDPMPKPIILESGEDTYRIIFGKRQNRLPFSLKLVDFKKESYPGVNMAKAYSSALVIQDGEARWPVTIEMNKPLRYKGYTFFQSSFEQAPDVERTILSVVKNKARLFPYAGTFILTFGLLWHIVMLTRRKAQS